MTSCTNLGSAIPAALIALTAWSCSGSSVDLSNDERTEVAAVVETFVNAFGNADADALDELFGSGCTEEQRELVRQSALMMSQLTGVAASGTYRAEVDHGKLLLERQDERITVPLEQPAGAISATATINGHQVPVEEPLLVEAPLRFTKEDGAWKLASCVLFVNEPEDEVDESDAPLP
jgi:hypothetical protein